MHKRFTSCALFLSLTLYHGCYSAGWLPSNPHDGTTMKACMGGEIEFLWDYYLDNGDRLHDIQWTFQGLSQEIMGIFTHGSFVTLPAFTDRVYRYPSGTASAPGAIRLTNVTRSDQGNYTIEVTGIDVQGLSFTIKSTVNLEVADSQLNFEEGLNITQTSSAIFDPTQNAWGVQLLCGPFHSQHQSPFDVQWILPSDRMEKSHNCSQGQFSLLLAGPFPEGGKVSCRVPAATACLAQDVEASLLLDTTSARLAILEAQRSADQARLTSLTAENQMLLQRLNETVFNLTEQGTALQNINAVPPVAFYARELRTSTQQNGNPFIFSKLVINRGDAFDIDTGIFTVPHSGTYFLAATSGPKEAHMFGGIYLKVDGTVQGYANAMGESSSEEAALISVLVLHKGQRVFLVPVNNPAEQWTDATTFCGFRISY